jgi:L-threonylcarbamoyladenylate synthase
VLADLGGRIDLIIDGGPAAVGLESTVLDLVSPLPTLLRPGGVTLEMLQSVLGEVAVAPGVSADPREGPVARPRSPGMKYRHYAPKAPLTLVEGAPEAVLGEIRRLVAGHPRDAGRLSLLVSAEAATGLRDLIPSGQAEPSLVVLGRRDDPEGMAAALFARLRELDETGAALIIAEGYADTGVGLALMNRLRRAAGGRIVRV